MRMDWNVLLAMVLFFLPCILALQIILRKRKARQESRRAPFPELQRRPAGEALRIKLQNFDEQINEDAVCFAAIPALVGVFFLILHGLHWSVILVCFVVSAGSAIFYGLRLMKLAEERANYRLGYEGERFVGEELSRLIGLGFEIYHDVPFDGFNIDHVVVGCRGVYAVETKTRRKPATEERPKVCFDGEQLNWQWGSDRGDLKQVERNATTLGNWLREDAALKNVWAIGILTFPGWWVERKTRCENVHVLNAKEIYTLCSSQPEQLSDAQLRSICEKLNAKCRIAVT